MVSLRPNTVFCMKFESYHILKEIKRSLALMGFNRPTDIQFKAIPPILAGEDVLAIAQTGTGKTAAFAIPVIHNIGSRKARATNGGIKCVVMEPTRELALQVTQVFQEIGQFTNVKTFCVFGGVEQDPQIAQLQSGIDIMVVTPGRMFDLVSQGFIDLKTVEVLILDEADHMLDLGFINDIRDIIRFLPKYRQTLFFSATIDEKIKDLAYSLVRKAIRIQISPNDPVSKNINHSVAFVKMDDKRFFLERIINENVDKKILVFVRTKVRAERVSAAMQRVDIQSETLHGDKLQVDRISVLKRFGSGEVKVLVATDVSARGIDIPDVDYVINYDLPEVPENYVHRVGRTGRGVRRGIAVSFCSEEEEPLLKAIEGYTGNAIKVLDISKTEYEETIDFSAEASNDWKSLMKEAEELEALHKKNEKKARAKKLSKAKKK